MKKLFTSISALLLIINVQGYSQALKPAVSWSKSSHASSSGNTKMNWINSDKMPDNIPAFEENKGQFPEFAKGWKILYGCNYDGVEIFLTDKGIIYNIAKEEQNDKDSKRKVGDIDKDTTKYTIKYQHIFISWENASVNSRVEAQDKTSYYFSEGISGKPKESVSNISGFEKVVYYDLYPGIDLEFSFHKDKGIKYAIKVKPGYDGSVFKMKYAGASKLALDNSGDLHIGTMQGDIIDYAPVVSSGAVEIPSSFQMDGKDEIGFKFKNTNKQNGVLIDPWTVFPIIVATYAINTGVDAAGNTYVLEYSPTPTYIEYLQKYSSTGTLLWTYTLNEFTTTPYNPVETDSTNCDSQYPSGFAMDCQGNSYVVAPWGFQGLVYTAPTNYGMICVNALASRTFLDYTYNADSIYETWNAAYSNFDTTLVEASCFVCCDEAQFDGVNLTTGNPNPGEYVNANIGEIYAGTIAPNGNYYALTAQNNSAAADQLLCCKVTKTSTSLLWQTNTTYPYVDATFKETPYEVGSNGIASGCAYLYTSDGLTLDQRNLSTGVIIHSVAIPGGSNSSLSVNSGIAVDLICGNVYVGSNTAIYAYDQNLNSIGSFTGLPGTIYDVKYNDGVVSACGDNGSNQGFVLQVNALPCAPGLAITHTDASCSAAGSATANPSFCTAPYYYLWTPGGKTTQTITGLSAGTYTVTVSPGASCLAVSDTVTIHGVVGSIINTSKDSVCSGDTVTLGIDSVAGMTFKWSPGGATTAEIHATITTTTTFTAITNGGPCPNDTTYFTVSTIHPVTGSVSALQDTICPGGTATLSATGSGGTITYKWNTGATTSSINVTPSVTTTYTATIYGTCGSINKPITVTVEPLPVASFTGKATLCIGFKDTINVSGGCSYAWDNGSTATSYYTGDINADSTIYVTIKSCFGCTAIDSLKITPTNPPLVSVNNGTICPGSCITLTANASGAGLTYNWNTGATTDTITVCPIITTTYTVKVSDGCIASKVTTVTVTPFSISACCDTTINQGQSTPINAGGSSQYTWTPAAGLNCDTCPNVIATPTSTTTYTVTGSDANGCGNSRIITVIVEVPCFNFTVPNVFTPTNSGLLGLDNIFYIKTENITAWSISIYDRWGKVMFQSTNPDDYWNGTSEGGGAAPAGVYYYILSGTCQGTNYKKQGYVQLIR